MNDVIRCQSYEIGVSPPGRQFPPDFPVSPGWPSASRCLPLLGALLLAGCTASGQVRSGQGGSSGGASAGGGSPSSGGSQGLGGVTSSGGTSRGGGSTQAGSGGVASSGGTNGGGSTVSRVTGGAPGNGGTMGTGGATGSGGTKGFGGMTTSGSDGASTRPDTRSDAGRGGTDGGGPDSSGNGGNGTGGGAGSSTGGATGAGTGGSPGPCTGPAPSSRGSNPLFTDQFTADPAAMVDNCTFYITCGHDQATAGQNAFVMKEWYLMRSTDMVVWTKSVVMSLSTFKWANANAWAGQMIRAGNGKYYWYVPIQQSSDGTMTIGVGMADKPEGPWTDALGKPLINDAFEMANMGFKTASDTSFTIDPTVFIDDDGQAYLQYGGFGRLTTAKLGSDMISIDGKMVESSPQGYFESPYLIKRNGKYYEIYAAGSNPATIDWATSGSPMGPWSYGGRILDALPRASGETDWPTNHAGVAEFAGQWYIVYHISNGPNGGGTYRREVAIDKLTWSGDKPQKVTPSTGLSF
jgi:hypothetical protein